MQGTVTSEQHLREWMVGQGCLIHPHLDIPARINGVQGVATSRPIPPHTLILAIPSRLILTVSKCYMDPVLHRLFKAEDDLFDYQASEDAQFNVLCVFLMYHRLNIETSPWRHYLRTIAEPQTAVDWGNHQLTGLNKSVIEEIIHVRRECATLQNTLVKYLLKRKEFPFSEEVLRNQFHYSYRAVMTRCFGYYFNEACLIPIADLVNHSCESVDHQLIKMGYERGEERNESYVPRHTHIDCSLMSLPITTPIPLPVREQFLLDRKLISPQQLYGLTRGRVHQLIEQYNREQIKGKSISALQFCEEEDSEDNDTDEDQQAQQAREYEQLRLNEDEQMKLFRENYVVVSEYKCIEEQLLRDGYVPAESNLKQNEQALQKEEKEEEAEQRISKWGDNDIAHKQNEQIRSKESKRELEEQDIPHLKQSENEITSTSSEQDESSDSEHWGLQADSYFTMSTSSALPANQEIFNSYGCRTNRFLLIWYGFTYPDNLYDSVSFRLQVGFNELRAARQVVLDTYIGGHGLSFRKSENELVTPRQLSKEFRLKRSRINLKLLCFLRLLLMNYYKGPDLYKLFCTFPSSLNFQMKVVEYYRDILLALLDRYPLSVIEQLKKEGSRKAYYKLVYVVEQRKIVEANLKGVKEIIRILGTCGMEQSRVDPQAYAQTDMKVLRTIRKYIVQLDDSYQYIKYQQEQVENTQGNSLPPSLPPQSK